LTPLPIDPREKVCHHIDAIFGTGVSNAISIRDMQFNFSNRTGRIKNVNISGRLAVTLRTDGGLALTIAGAQYLVENSKQFRENCVEPIQEAVPFVSEGRSLFCKHIKWCGSNIKVASDVAVVDNVNSNKVVAVGIAVLPSRMMGQYRKGVAVKIRQGIKGRTG
jgi:conserved protein with predicted RNA binding PUA domain